MKLPLKYIIVIFAFIAGFVSFTKDNLGAGIAAAAAFLVFGALEIYDLKIANSEEQSQL